MNKFGKFMKAVFVNKLWIKIICAALALLVVVFFEYLKQIPSLRKMMLLREWEFRADPVARLLFEDQRLFFGKRSTGFSESPFFSKSFPCRWDRTDREREGQRSSALNAPRSKL